MLLNHVVLGILLLQLGSLTFYSARPAFAGVAWAVTVSRTVALAVVTLPPTLLALVEIRYFAAIPFLVAVVIVCVASVTLFGGSVLAGARGSRCVRLSLSVPSEDRPWPTFDPSTCSC